MPIFKKIITNITRADFDALLESLHSQTFESDTIAFGATQEEKEKLGLEQRRLIIEGREARHDDYYAILDAIYDCKNIEHFGLRHIHCRLEGPSYDKLIAMMETRFVTIDITNYGFYPGEILDAIMMNPELKHLGLSGVYCLGYLFSELSHLIMTNRLETLDMSYLWPFEYQAYTERDFLTLLDMLRYNSSLNELNLSGFDRYIRNNRENYYHHLKNALIKNKSLKTLILNDLSYYEPRLLSKLIKKNTGLTNFVFDTEVDEDEKKIIEARLSANKLLQQVGAKKILSEKIEDMLKIEGQDDVQNRKACTFLYDDNLEIELWRYADLSSMSPEEQKMRLTSAEAKLSSSRPT